MLTTVFAAYTRWLLRHRRAPLDITATVDRLAAGSGVVAGLLPGVLSADARAVHAAVASSLAGVWRSFRISHRRSIPSAGAHACSTSTPSATSVVKASRVC